MILKANKMFVKQVLLFGCFKMLKLKIKITSIEISIVGIGVLRFFWEKEENKIVKWSY